MFGCKTQEIIYSMKVQLLFWYLFKRQNIHSVPIMTFIKKNFYFQLDGFIARNWANQKSALGSALDPLADKILISILYISLTYADLIPGKNAIMRTFKQHREEWHQLRISLWRQITLVPKIYFSTFNCYPNFKLLNCFVYQTVLLLEFMSLLYQNQLFSQ